MWILGVESDPLCIDRAYYAEEMDRYLDELQAENARFREALKKIDDEWEAYDRGYTDYGQGYDDALDMVSDIARAALGKED
jgi:hypothetical protein